MSLMNSLSIARQSLFVNQLGLQVTSQNIANVNTPGYKRQRVNQANLPYGLGVEVTEVERQLNPYAEKRLLKVTSDTRRAEDTAIAFGQLENLFNELADRGLDKEFEDFFKAVQDLTGDPSGVAERATLKESANSMGDLFNFFYKQMQDQMVSQEDVIKENVAKINSITANLTRINRQIVESIENKVGINELRNTRDELVRELSEIIPVRVMEDRKDSFTLYVENGMPLVNGVEQYELEMTPDTTNDLKGQVFWVSDRNARMDITDTFSTGTLGAALEIRNEIIPSQMQQLDKLAAEFIQVFNRQHRLGTGLDGESGRNFFDPVVPYTRIGQGSSGGATITNAVVTDDALLTMNDYELRFTGPDNYQLVNISTGATLQEGAYTPGMTIEFDGLELTVDNQTGPPEEGDVFHINNYGEASTAMKVNDAIEDSLDVIAAGFTGTSGDNQNALLLADIENKAFAAGNTMNFREMYQSMLVEVGLGASTENNEYDNQDTLLSQITNLVESVSGVSTDEEATVLITYQRAYQASAKVVTTTDSMLESTINMVR